VSFERWTGVTLSSINDDALDHARLRWPRNYDRTQTYGKPVSWDTLLHKFRARPSFFDIAVWRDIDGERVLQALALGKPNKKKTKLVLNYIEANLAQDAFKAGILFPVLAAAEHYAHLLGCSKVVIVKPVDHHVYRRYGYQPENGPELSGGLWKGVPS
jgi:hypothetical protein